MKVYHVCAAYHDNCCDQPLFATKEAALKWLRITEAELIHAPEQGVWYTNILSRDPNWRNEKYVLVEMELRE